MRLRLLGPVTLHDSRGEPVAVGGPRAQAVLAVLAVQAGQVVTADRLIDQIWGEHTPDSARVTLQTYLYRLRAVSRGASAMLPRRSAGYLLDPSAVEIDVDRFSCLAEWARTAAADHRWADALRCSGQAVALWGGDPFTGINEVRLLDLERERLRELRAENHVIAIEARLELSGPTEVLAELRELVETDRWDERARRLLVRTLYLAGRQTEALEAVAVARRELLEEHGLEPSPELAELAERILCHDPSLRGTARPSGVGGDCAGTSARPPPTECTAEPVAGRSVPTDVPATTAAVPDAPRSGPSPPIGRASACAQLREAWDSVHADRRAVFRLVTGERGVGKTHLVEHLAADIARDAATVTVGRCLDRPRLPLQPWSDLIDDPSPAAGPHGAVPGVAGQTPTDLDPVAVHRTFRGVVEAVRAGTRDGAQLLVLENLQWAEVAALRLLEILLDRCAHDPLLVVGTVRSPPVASPQTAAALAVLRHRPGAAVVGLSGLGAIDLARAVAAHGVTVGPADVDALHARTGGIPLLALEAVRGEDGVVAGLLDAVGGAVEVAELMAVAGGWDGPALLARACELDLAGLDEALSRLVDAGLVRPAPGREPVYEFSRALYREAVEARLTPLRRIVLSRRLLAAADAVPGGVSATTLARRAVVVAASGDPDDVRRARAECRRAARSPRNEDPPDAPGATRPAIGLDEAAAPVYP